MKKYDGEKYIVSFTSFGARFDSACKMIFSLKQQTYTNFHIVMTVYKDDVKNITPNMQTLIDNNVLEVIVADENLCPHLKYYYAMKKYWDKPIITVDDDRYYHPEIISSLVKKYESLMYKSVISVVAPIMSKHGNCLDVRTKWCRPERRLEPDKKSFIAMAEGFAGVLYPEKCFKDIDTYKDIIYAGLHDDDICLKAMEILEKIPTTQISTTSKKLSGFNLANTQEYSLANRLGADMNYRNDVTANKLNYILIKGFTL